MTDLVFTLAIVGVVGYYVWKNYHGQVSAAIGDAVKNSQLDALGLADDSGDGGG